MIGSEEGVLPPKGMRGELPRGASGLRRVLASGIAALFLCVAVVSFSDHSKSSVLLSLTEQWPLRLLRAHPSGREEGTEGGTQGVLLEAKTVDTQNRNPGNFWRASLIDFHPPTTSSGEAVSSAGAGWLARLVTRSRPTADKTDSEQHPSSSSSSFSSSSLSSAAGPGWLAFYTPELKAPARTQMNRHLHMELLQACASAFEAMSRVKACMEEHGKSAEAAIRFIHNVPGPQIEGSTLAVILCEIRR